MRAADWLRLAALGSLAADASVRHFTGSSLFRGSEMEEQCLQIKTIVDQHRQKYRLSCIPSCVEMVLKILGKVSVDYYDLQDSWQNKADGSFADFDGYSLGGIVFRHRFALPRDNNFPIGELFDFIDDELKEGRLVCVSLQEKIGYHMYLICAKQGQEYLAFSKNGSETIWITNVCRRIEEMRGTDILFWQYNSSHT